MQLVPLHPLVVLLGAQELLDAVTTVPVYAVVPAKAAVDYVGLLELEHQLIEPPNNAAGVVHDGVEARLAGEAASVGDVQQEGDVVAAGEGLRGGEGFVGVRAYYSVVLQSYHQQDASDVVDQSVGVGVSVLA